MREMEAVGFVSLTAPLPLRQGRLCLTPRRRPSHVARRRTQPAALFGRKARRPQGFALNDAPEYEFEDLQTLKSTLNKPGAYAVRDHVGVLQYVGYAKDVYVRLQQHQIDVPSKCSCFHTYVPELPKKDVTPELLEGVLEYWVSENGGMPVGNTKERAQWESFGKVS